ncbi:MAG: amidohydrolase family protein [Verrucomicrobia bacterium]|nr:amidohydrolase family protein [Verrucomicrobiota bacterium]
MKLADAHLHLFRQGYAGRYGAAWVNPHELQLYETFRRVHGIESGLVIGYEGRPAFRGNNRDLAAWARKHPWITPLAFLPVTSPPTVKLLEARLGQGFAGLALYVLTVADAEPLNCWSISALQWLNEHRQILSFNARPEALAQLKPFLAKLDQCPTLISHLGLPGRYTAPPSQREARKILQPLRSLAKLRQVGVKLSGLYALSEPSHAYPHRSARPFLLQLYDDFGPERLYWGSDFSPALEHVSFPQTIDVLFQLGWPASDLCRIMHDNLTRVLREHRPNRRVSVR